MRREMSTPTARTHPARRLSLCFRWHVRRFLNWWKEAPFYKSLWFIPLVMMLYIAAVIKNFVTGDHSK